MPRSLSPDFEAEKDRRDAEWFLTARFEFDAKFGGTLRVDELGRTVAGNAHEPIVLGWGSIGSSFRQNAESLDSFSARLQLVNHRILAGNTKRFSDYVVSNVEGTKVAVDIHFVKDDGTILTQPLFYGSLVDPIEWDLSVASVTVEARWLKHLQKDVLRTLSSEVYGHARPSDEGRTIGMFWGTVPRVPVRLSKGVLAALPTGAAANTGTAELSGIEIAIDYAVSGTSDIVRIVFTSTTAYDIRTDEHGALGSGSVNSDGIFASGGGTIVVRASAWNGAPQAGDTFTIPIDTSGVIGVVAESPSGSPVQSLSGVYANGYRLSESDVIPPNDPNFEWNLRLNQDAELLDRGATGLQPGTGISGSQQIGTASARAVGLRFVVPSRMIDPEVIGFEFHHSPPLFSSAGQPIIARLTTSLRADGFLSSGGTTDPPGVTLFRRTLAFEEYETTNPTLVDSMRVRVRPGGSYYVVIGTSNLASANYDVTLRTTVASDEFPEDARLMTGSAITAISGKQLHVTVYIRGRSGNVEALGDEAPQGTFLFAYDMKEAVIAKSLGVGLSVDPGVVGSATVEFIRADGIDVNGGEVLNTFRIPATAVTGTPSTIRRSFDPPRLLLPGRYWGRVTAEDESTTAEDGTVTPRSFYFRARLGNGASLLTGGYDQFADLTFYALGTSGRLQPIGTGHPHLQDSNGTPVLVDWDLEVVKFTRQVSAVDGEGERVAQLVGDVPALEAGIELTVDGNFIQRRRPDDWAHFLLNRAGYDDSEIDLAGSFAGAAAEYPSYFRFDGGVLEQMTYAQLLLKGARESRSAFLWPIDKAEWHRLPDPTAAVDVVLDDDDLVLKARNLPDVSVTKSPVAEVVNRVDVRYRRRFWRSDDSYAATVTKQFLASVPDLGELRKDALWAFDLVRNGRMAADDAQFWVTFLGEAKQRLRAAFKLDYFEVKQIDKIELSIFDGTGSGGASTGYGEGGYGEGGYGGSPTQLTGTQNWLVEMIEYELERGRIVVHGRGF